MKGVVTTLRLIGYKLGENNEQLLLAVHRGLYYVRHNDIDTEVKVSYEMVPDGTYADNVRDVPYFVLDNRVHTLKSFESLETRRK